MARQIAICGFADSKNQAPWTDSDWEKWTVNDLYKYVTSPGQVHRVFEMHHLIGLGPRRNPDHEKWLKSGMCPVYMQEHRPEYPSSVALPRMELMECFGDAAFGGRAGCDYFTNSVSWMIALALYETSSWVTLPDGRRLRLCDPGTKIHLYGIDMAGGMQAPEGVIDTNSEYAAQRPSCEFWLGVAKCMGVELHIPDNSDLLKAPALYGYDTSAPLRVKLQGKLQNMKEQKIQVMQQRAQLQAQLVEAEKAIAKIDGATEMAKYVQGVWTMPTDIAVGQETAAKHRTPVILEDQNGHQDKTFIELSPVKAG